MNNIVWRKGTPPHVGWWASKVREATGYWRWWDGVTWSCAAPDWTTAQVAANLYATVKILDPENVVWSGYYPRNARVPRINPTRGTTP